MKMRHTVLALTGAAVTALTGLFAVLQWDDATQVAPMVSAVIAVGSLGVTVWAALPGSRVRSRSDAPIRVARTGTARVGTGGTANTGVMGSAATVRRAEVEDTGEAEAGDGGDANTGVKEG
ncbi:hypothetical protein ACFOY4_40985 [Actinomadura syzygii]|uniref:Uncharacterized protein n=1 Tax=Actinomadura syzygii TaxID=1427538 RepID=A0A5D0TPL5_9ACTN|nr:hypothetical protein [Actinomadura syzygii]TYC07340.1 hypothetical protein FXF65_43055 [Actinomadura syzygii]